MSEKELVMLDESMPILGTNMINHRVSQQPVSTSRRESHLSETSLNTTKNSNEAAKRTLSKYSIVEAATNHRKDALAKGISSSSTTDESGVVAEIAIEPAISGSSGSTASVAVKSKNFAAEILDKARHDKEFQKTALKTGVIALGVLAIVGGIAAMPFTGGASIIPVLVVLAVFTAGSLAVAGGTASLISDLLNPNEKEKKKEKTEEPEITVQREQREPVYANATVKLEKKEEVEEVNISMTQGGINDLYRNARLKAKEEGKEIENSLAEWKQNHPVEVKISEANDMIQQMSVNSDAEAAALLRFINNVIADEDLDMDDLKEGGFAAATAKKIDEALTNDLAPTIIEELKQHKNAFLDLMGTE